MNPYAYITKTKKAVCTPAQTALRNAFLELYAERPLALITVTRLCAHAHVARTTFYAIYQNIDSLLNEIENDLIVDLLKIDALNPNPSDPEQGIEHYSEKVYTFISANRLTLSALLLDQPDLRLIEKWKAMVKYHFWDISKSARDTKDGGLALEIIAAAAVAGYTYVLKNLGTIDPGEVSSRLLAALRAIEY